MNHFKILTVFPEIIETYLQNGVVAQALKKGLAKYSIINPRDFVQEGYRAVDDRPFGGGDGMVMLPEILEKALLSTQSDDAFVVYLSPQGKPLTDKKVTEMKERKNLILICGRYSGLDQRLINEFVDEEISLGDFVMSGGELGALALIDSVLRKIPGVLGHGESAEKDSFSDGILEHPLFTRPQVWKEQEVPAVLLSGNHQAIEIWRQNLNILVTLKKRPDLLNLSEKELRKIGQFYTQMSGKEKVVCGIEGLERQLGL
jgi:tRNA (guanine37-N1)-methyltransferase